MATRKRTTAREGGTGAESKKASSRKAAPMKGAPERGTAREATARKAGAEPESAAAKPARKAPRARKTPAATATTPEAAASEAAPVRPAAEAAPRERVIFARELYDARKDDIKAPLKERDLKWQFLGSGKGRYHKEGVQVFVQQTDAGADFTIWGEDRDAVAAILAEWRKVAGASAMAEAKEAGAAAKVEEAQAAVSEAVRLWELEKPLRRPGEPEGFYKRRVTEWEARRPTS